MSEEGNCDDEIARRLDRLERVVVGICRSRFGGMFRWGPETEEDQLVLDMAREVAERTKEQKP